MAKEYLNNYQVIVLNRIVRRLINNNVNVEEGYYFDNSIPFDKNDPKIFPTSYFIESIYCYIMLTKGILKY